MFPEFALRSLPVGILPWGPAAVLQDLVQQVTAAFRPFVGHQQGALCSRSRSCWSCSVSLLWRFRVSSQNMLVCAVSFTANLPRGDVIISGCVSPTHAVSFHSGIPSAGLFPPFPRPCFHVEAKVDVTRPHWTQSVKASDPPLLILSGSHLCSEMQGFKCFRWWRQQN